MYASSVCAFREMIWTGLAGRCRVEFDPLSGSYIATVAIQ